MRLEVHFAVSKEVRQDPMDPAILPPPYYRCRFSSMEFKRFLDEHLKRWWKANPGYGHECVDSKVMGWLMEELGGEKLVVTGGKY